MPPPLEIWLDIVFTHNLNSCCKFWQDTIFEDMYPCSCKILSASKLIFINLFLGDNRTNLPTLSSKSLQRFSMDLCRVFLGCSAHQKLVFAAWGTLHYHDSSYFQQTKLFRLDFQVHESLTCGPIWRCLHDAVGRSGKRAPLPVWTRPWY